MDIRDEALPIGGGSDPALWRLEASVYGLLASGRRGWRRTPIQPIRGFDASGGSWFVSTQREFEPSEHRVKRILAARQLPLWRCQADWIPPRP